MKPYISCQKRQELSVNCEFLNVIPDISAREGSFIWRNADRETGEMFWVTFASLNVVVFILQSYLWLDPKLIHVILTEKTL